MQFALQRLPATHLNRRPCLAPRLSSMSKSGSGSNSLMWFRKGLRIHDNPALEYAARGSGCLYPVFVIDPHYMEPDPNAFSPGSSLAGLNRIRFLLESLVDLDLSLRRLGSRLLVMRGEPGEIISSCLKEWDIKKLCFEFDTDPYYWALDVRVKNFASVDGIEIFCPVSHTLFNPADIIQKNGGKAPLTYQSFLKLAGDPTWAASPLSLGLSSLPPIGDVGCCHITDVPTVNELGYDDLDEDGWSPFKGGETQALARLQISLADKEWVSKFEKPKGDPSAFLKPATTVLSPYLKIPWDDNNELLVAWRDAKTGFPWIDAIMTQLRKWGWMHHLARHCVACFLTRGDLFIHWEKGRHVFDRLLIDGDWSINNGNWLWLSCSSFFYQYNRIYSPISFGKKYDPEGKFIRHFLPVLKDMPKQYIYEPWTAPLSFQIKANCIIGKDYPKSVVSHDVASKECKRKMGEAYALNQKLRSQVSDEDLKNLRRKLEESRPHEEPKPKKLKQKLIG